MVRTPSSGRYILEDRKVVPCPDLYDWAAWYEKVENRRVGCTKVGRFTVYTTFLGIDHNFFGEGPPVVFETMIDFRYDRPHEETRFGRRRKVLGDFLPYQERYTTWEAAEEGHADAVAMLEAELAEHEACAQAYERERFADDESTEDQLRRHLLHLLSLRQEQVALSEEPEQKVVHW